ncbi:MAG: lipid-A-disaccharide synthase [Candidatus Omnitrophica bacterium]|nr:lipid-A-disaccharide synthase [Candidatus Omnitrophota bacterium]
MPVNKRIMIVCGEPSGDLHAGALARELLKRNPELTIEGVGGDHLRSSAAHIIADIRELAAFGLFNVITKLPRFLSLKKRLLERIRRQPYEAVILVDFSGFNLRLARELPEELPVFYYISPQIWASRPGRIRTVKQHIKKMIVLFPFEEEFYRSHEVPVACVGHPLLDIVRPSLDKKVFQQTYGLNTQEPICALLAGSRESEIKHILPVMAQAALHMREHFPSMQFIIAQAANLATRIYTRILEDEGISAKLIQGKPYDCINAADLCLVASGTATLETAIIGKPFLIIYRMDMLNYLLYRPQIKIPYIGMVNIVAGKRLVPEFVQFQAKPEAIAGAGLALLRSPEKRVAMQEALQRVTSLLGTPGAAGRAAEIILNDLAS